jgi:hypothetical protein
LTFEQKSDIHFIRGRFSASARYVESGSGAKTLRLLTQPRWVHEDKEGPQKAPQAGGLLLFLFPMCGATARMITPEVSGMTTRTTAPRVVSPLYGLYG